MTAWLAALSLATAIALGGRPPTGSRLARLTRAPKGPARPRSAVPGAAVVIGTAIAAARVPLPLIAIAAAAALSAWRVRRAQCARRARGECAAAMSDVTFALVGELRAGRTPAQALSAVAGFAGPLRPAFEAAQRAVSVGADAADELARAALLPGAQRLRYVAVAWAVAESAGGRVAVVLERLSESMDSEDELRRELDAAMAGPRATMALLAGLPLVGIALGQAVGARPLDLLLHRPIGWTLLAAAIVLDGLGVLATRAIARVALRG